MLEEAEILESNEEVKMGWLEFSFLDDELVNLEVLETRRVSPKPEM